MAKEIPTPTGYPILGNVPEVDSEHPHDSLARFAEIYGPVFRLRLPADRIFVANYALAQDLFDEKRFQKSVSGPLEQMRNAIKDGLFTAYPGEPHWASAHRILVPAFGPLAIREMFGEMNDIVMQLVLKWARFGPNQAFNVSEDFTRLTLDSIALCAMGDRFNSFYKDTQHPFVKAMNGVLRESFLRSRRPALANTLLVSQSRSYQANITELETTARQLLAARRENPVDKKDLLNAMINGKDPVTGETLGDDIIIRNMITFLIAGHETTSGLLSFTFYELLQNPSAMKQAVQEVDQVIGKDTITVSHMSKLPFIEACLRESLRLHPTAPGITLQAKGDQLLGGEYIVRDKEVVNILLARMHRDPEIYGPDAEEFKPERMLDENFRKLPPNAWKPFGNGMRACIGRPFAWQEAILAVATLLQKFHLTKDSPSYQLRVKTTLTIKPEDFYIRAKLRDPSFLENLDFAEHSAHKEQVVRPDAALDAGSEASSQRLDILYGSNTGTCEALARSLVSSATARGIRPDVKSLDSATSRLPKDYPVVVITASYEGNPPDNAAHFVEWLKSAGAKEASDVSYAVFGVGNKEWYNTYQKIPRVIDEGLGAMGGRQMIPRSAVDVSEGNIFDAFDKWQEDELWPAFDKLFQPSKTQDAAENAPQELKLSIGTSTRSTMLHQDVLPGRVFETRLLTKAGVPRKRHIGITLPSGTSYRAGDYLAVLPINPPSVVARVMKRFELPWDATITIDESQITSLPTGKALSVQSVLSGMLEIGQPVTTKLALAVAKTVPEQQLSKELEDRIKTDFQKATPSLLDILEDYPSAAFSFSQYLAAVPPMHLRQYSISSTPLASPTQCTLTYSVIDSPSKTSRHGHPFLGVASTYLERLEVGDHLQIGLRPSRNGFHLPADNQIPVIMACAGTGLAPFRAFVAERAIQRMGGLETGPALLFYGCHAPEDDDLYREEFDEWERSGVVSVRRAYSAMPGASENCRFVQDRIWLDKSDIVDLFRKDAQVYVCGGGTVGNGIEAMFAKIRISTTGCSEAEATKWIKSVKGDRYWADIFL